ncbi:MAG: LPS export ABC transporter periplasmic protein LptC [Muribaculaceae bacterium]|nr:LPS export ABC transporter periplasmic protein LptC [Muribaculaceae bacterium]MDE5713131.1 LPS export ABC transporter periplasmic protein LptC [Muribaculaceae bacterium]
MRKTGLSMAFATALAIAAGSCTRETKVDISNNLNPARMPSMVTHNISTLISDSGVTQYKIVAPVWYVYDEVDTPYWLFPEGLYLQKFDPEFNVIATVAADSARFFKLQKLWKLEGNVEMTKAPRDLFLSERVFWDQRKSRLYSDTFIHIENETHILEGTGFESNERLTQYRILHPSGIFPVERDNLRPDSK